MKRKLASRVLLCGEFTNGENSSFKRVETHKKIKSQLANNMELETDGLNKGRDRENEPRMSDRSGNARKKWETKNNKSVNNRNRRKK